MSNIITIGKRVIPVEQIVCVEPFDAAGNPDLRSEKSFKARVVLANGDTILAETTPQEFAAVHAFRLLAEDDIAVNPAIAFWVEAFTPAPESFNPGEPYATRLKWRAPSGIEHSWLLLSSPETVIAVAVRGETEPARKSGQRGPRFPRAEARAD